MDMAGNVWEWVADWYHSNYIGAPSNGSAWIDPAGTDRVARGGSFPDSDILIRSARRGVDGPTSRNGFLGARCVRDLPSIDLRIGVTN
jgi:formylglycine-generating enzyme required for sulfatase activity